jgi:hypothetical protein
MTQHKLLSLELPRKTVGHTQKACLAKIYVSFLSTTVFRTFSPNNYLARCAQNACRNACNSSYEVSVIALRFNPIIFRWRNIIGAFIRQMIWKSIQLFSILYMRRDGQTCSETNKPFFDWITRMPKTAFCCPIQVRNSPQTRILVFICVS